MIQNCAGSQTFAWGCALVLSLATATAQTSSSSSRKKEPGDPTPSVKEQSRGMAPVKSQDRPVGNAAHPPADDPFDAIATQLTSLLGEKKAVSVGVGNFAFQDTDLLSPFSALLRDELEVALNKTNGFKVVTRDRIADLQNEGKFQMRDLLEPGTAVEKVSVKGIEGIVRGRFYVSGSGVSVFTELVWLEGGNVEKTKVTLPSSQVAARLLPEGVKSEQSLGAIVTPQNMEASMSNLQEVTEGRLKRVAKEFPLEFFTTDTRRAFKQGEVVSFRVRSDRDCFVAVYCHQSDGQSVLLFPNNWQRSTFVPAGKAIDIPGTQKHGFEIEIGPPYGSDVVQVIACTSEREIERLVGRQLSTASASQPVAVMTRGMAVNGISEAGKSPNASTVPVLWSEAHMVVSTFPKN
jgi:Domain of unknown function (DUF4384)